MSSHLLPPLRSAQSSGILRHVANKWLDPRKETRELYATVAVVAGCTDSSTRMTHAGMAEVLGDVTFWLRGLREGNSHTDTRLVESLAFDLRRLAAARLRRECAGHTLTPTALVNEAWIRLAGQKEQWQSRSHFFGIAAQAMRRILVDHARRSHATKREVAKEQLSEDQIILDTGLATEDLIALDDALKQLAELSPRQARVVELRFFAGLTEDETAAVLDVNRRTINRDWEMARTWLFGQLQRKDRL